MDTLLYNQGEVAERLGISIRSLERWRCTGEGPRYIKLGRQVRYTCDDLEAWLAERSRRSTSEAGSL
jgi:predicted DNA-binding transcriptional regulator AlpA